MPYRIFLKPSAEKALADLPRDIVERLDPLLLELRENPRPRGSTKLAGIEGLYRIRAGDYRVIYQIRDDKLVVLVVRIAHRREAYR